MKTELHAIMLDHIAEEPVLAKKLLDDRWEYTAAFRALFRDNNIRRVYFSGSGSPANACQVLRYFCTRLLGLECSYEIPTVFNYHLDFNTQDYAPEESLLLIPAESGRTKGSVIAACRAKKLGIHTACTTFSPEGILARNCEVVLCKPSGREIALPSTKGHSMGIFIFLLCFVETAREMGRISQKEYEAHIDDLYSAVQAMESAQLKALAWFQNYQDEIMDSGSYWFIGYGANVGTVKECALKFLEATRRPSFGFELEEFMHGPLAAVKRGDMLFFLCAEEGAEKRRLLKLAHYCERVSGRCVVIGDSRDTPVGPMPIAFAMSGSETGSVLELLVPMQILAWAVADSLGLDLTQHSKHSAGKAMALSFSDDDEVQEFIDE